MIHFCRRFKTEIVINNQAQYILWELGFFSSLDMQTGMSADLPAINNSVNGIFLQASNKKFDNLEQVLSFFTTLYQQDPISQKNILVKVKIKCVSELLVYEKNKIQTYATWILANRYQIIATEQIKQKIESQKRSWSLNDLLQLKPIVVCDLVDNSVYSLDDNF